MAGRRERRKLGTRRALEDAALRLFARDGFDETTVEAIAAEVGVSARTFFRYFGSKEDVLYVERAERQDVLRTAMREAGPVDPLDALHRGLLAIAPTFEREQAQLQERAAARSAVLRGREAEVVRSWEAVMAAGLAERGDEDADVLAGIGVACFRAGVSRWLADDRPLADHFDEVVQAAKRARSAST